MNIERIKPIIKTTYGITKISLSSIWHPILITKAIKNTIEDRKHIGYRKYIDSQNFVQQTRTNYKNIIKEKYPLGFGGSIYSGFLAFSLNIIIVPILSYFKTYEITEGGKLLPDFGNFNQLMYEILPRFYFPGHSTVTTDPLEKSFFLLYSLLFMTIGYKLMNAFQNFACEAGVYDDDKDWEKMYKNSE